LLLKYFAKSAPTAHLLLFANLGYTNGIIIIIIIIKSLEVIGNGTI